MLNRLSPDQLQETVTSIDPTGLHEEAADVVSSNTSLQVRRSTLTFLRAGRGIPSDSQKPG